MLYLRSRIVRRFQGLERLRSAIVNPSTAIQDAVVQAERLYSTFITSRFDKFSKGSGNWRRVSESTARAKGNRLILVNMRDLRKWLPSGIRFRLLVSGPKFNFEASFRAGVSHPRAKMAMSKLAAIHDRGQGRNPKRQILVGVDETTRKRIRGLLIKAVRKAARGR